MNWPMCVLLLGISFFIIFFKPIAELIGRIRKISKDGITAEPDQVVQQQEQISPSERGDLEKLLDVGGFQSVFSQEQRIDETLKTKKLPDDSARIRVLVRHLAVWQMLCHFETTYAHIFGSQILLLKELQLRGGMKISEIEKFYKIFLNKISNVAEGEKWTLDIYLSYLIRQNLIIQKADVYKIQDIGVDFLVWMVKFQKSEAKVF